MTQGGRHAHRITHGTLGHPEYVAFTLMLEYPVNEPPTESYGDNAQGFYNDALQVLSDKMNGGTLQVHAPTAVTRRANGNVRPR